MKSYGIVKDIEKFDGRILMIGIAFEQHNVPRIPKQLLANAAWNARKVYIKYCKGLDKKVFERYEENLAKRLEKGFPEEATIIPNPGQTAKPSIKEIDDLKAYDAYKMYLAKKSKKDFFINEDGKLIIEEFIENELKSKDDNVDLKDMNDEYYSE